MKNENKVERIGMLVFIIATFVLFIAVLAIPYTRGVFEAWSGSQPYLMGFVKFGLLATAGELIAVRLSTGDFRKPPYLIARIIIWGVIGVWITYMMKIFFIGAGAMMQAGLLPNAGTTLLGLAVDFDNPWNMLIRAFATSATMNLSFGPTFMAIHKCSDTYLALRAERGRGVTLRDVIAAVDWHKFVSFTIFKTVPIFWIPAHTLTFLLPSQYQVMLAALLSVALGIILNLRRKAPKAKENA